MGRLLNAIWQLLSSGRMGSANHLSHKAESGWTADGNTES